MVESTQEQTGLGNYFVANYPPFSCWKPAQLPQAEAVLRGAPKPGTPLGLYLHIPFCRKRCKFCYFRVYTDKNARDVENYTAALVKEVELYSRQPVVGGRPLQFVYFGGGTPSYLSAAQLRQLMTRLQTVLPWRQAAEVTFECEPGTLQKHKLETLKELGVTRLSLGVENFEPKILEYNGRAHLEEEIYRAFGWARALGFDQINIDLIAGMVGENWDNWRECVQKTLGLGPDSVTVYQLELPFNTVFSRELKALGSEQWPAAGKEHTQATGLAQRSLAMVEAPSLELPTAHGPRPTAVADWPTKRAWVDYAFAELAAAGYQVSSAYTMVKDRARAHFVYRDSLWHGADMLGTGVASFGHVNGVHVQNVDKWEDYFSLLEKGRLPLGRALAVPSQALLIRETILQLKTGRLQTGYFKSKFGVDILKDFAAAFGKLQEAGFLSCAPDTVQLTRTGLLQVDRLLPEFFEPEHQGARYT